MFLENDVNLSALLDRILPQEAAVQNKTLARLQQAVDNVKQSMGANPAEVLELSDYLNIKYVEVCSKESHWFSKKNKDKKVLESLISKLNSIPAVEHHLLHKLNVNTKNWTKITIKQFNHLVDAKEGFSLSLAVLGNTRCFTCSIINPLSEIKEVKTASSFQELKDAYQRYESLKLIRELKDGLFKSLDTEVLEKTLFIDIRAASEIKIISDKYPLYFLPNGKVYFFDHEGISQERQLDLNRQEESLHLLKEIVLNKPDHIDSIKAESRRPLNARLGRFHEEDKV